MNSQFPIRKRLLDEPGAAEVRRAANEIDLTATATIHYSSEDPSHPVEHLFDGRSGRGATCWRGARENTTEVLVIEFDRAEPVRRVVFEAEEAHTERTQQLTLEYSVDRGETYRTGLVQEYTFSPGGSTYQREDLNLELAEVTHIRLTIVPSKGGQGRASLTSLRIFR